MSDRALQHRRVHNLLLIQKLLFLRDASSPFTLVLDSVEQSARPLVRHYIHHARASKTDVVFVSYESLKPPSDVTLFIQARRKDPLAIRKEIAQAMASSRRTLLILDSLYHITTYPYLPSFLSSLTSPTTSLLAIYHTDIPLPSSSSTTAYIPSPFILLCYLATTILTMHSFSQTLARKRAAEKSNPEPLFGTDEGKEGVLVGMGANHSRCCVVEMEHRRKSGRGIEEWFFLPEPNSNDRIVLLEDQELYRRSDTDKGRVEGDGPVAESATFELDLTAKQRRDREGVVLPYFDAQKGEGGGGRILYDMGVEDDFDEEEDEI